MVGGRKAASLYNGLLLNQESHTLWDECSVNFSLTSTPDLTTSIISVKLLGEPSKTQKWMTFVPPFLNHESDSLNSELHIPRPILHGDQMRIRTTNPVTHPLPDDFLMNIREILNHTVVTCGVSETLKTRLARAKAVEESRRREAKKRNRDDDDDDGEDAETRPSTADDGGGVNQSAGKKRRGQSARRGKSGNGGGEKGGTTRGNIEMANVEDRFLIPPSESELLRVFGPQRELELVDAYGDEDADMYVQQNESRSMSGGGEQSRGAVGGGIFGPKGELEDVADAYWDEDAYLHLQQNESGRSEEEEGGTGEDTKKAGPF